MRFESMWYFLSTESADLEKTELIHFYSDLLCIVYDQVR